MGTTLSVRYCSNVAYHVSSGVGRVSCLKTAAKVPGTRMATMKSDDACAAMKVISPGDVEP